MSITALITGRLLADPERRTSASGKGFTTARLSAATEGEDSAFVSVIAFGTTAEQLAALGKGDALSMTGRAKPKAWLKDGEPKAGLDLVAEQLLTAYHLKRKRQAMAPAATEPGRQGASAGRPASAPSRADRAPHQPEFEEDEAWLRGGS